MNHERNGAPIFVLAVLWIALAAAFAALAPYARAMDTPGAAGWEIDLSQAVQRWSPEFTHGIAVAVSYSGDGWRAVALTAAACLLLLAFRQPGLPLLVLLATSGRLLSPVLKDLIGRARPTPDIVDVHDTRADLAFPSGHALGATLLYGALIYAIGRTVPYPRLRAVLQAVCGAMIALMAWSRVELGEHWPTDVLGGCLLGAMVVLPLAAAHSRLWPRRREA